MDPPERPLEPLELPPAPPLGHACFVCIVAPKVHGALTCSKAKGSESVA